MSFILGKDFWKHQNSNKLKYQKFENTILRQMGLSQKSFLQNWFFGQNNGFELFDHEFSKKDKKRPGTNIPSRLKNWPLCYV